MVTGGAGFIGSHLCRRLLGEGHKVTCVDNLLTGSIKNIEEFFPNEHFSFLKKDITEFIHVPGRLDEILHFASPASPIDYLELPIQTLKVGALGTHKVLGLAKGKKAKLLLASTSEVYGDPLEHPQSEDYWGNVNPIGPRGVYDEAKRFAEALVMAYHRTHHVDTRIIRIFNTYGPNMRIADGRVVPNFIKQALAGEDLTVYGSGEQTRSFCYVDDLVNGVLAALEKGDCHPINLGNPHEFSINEFAETVIRLTGSRSKLSFDPLPVDDPQVRQPNITRAKELLEWDPRILLDDGLRRTIEYFQKLEIVT
jgi:dTDP-glucose 4,6-dehydratase